MGDFFEPEPIESLAEKPHVFTDEFISSMVKKSIDNGDMPADHKLAFVGIVDEQGIQAILTVKVMEEQTPLGKLDIKIQSAVEHEWKSGDNKAGAKLLLTLK